MIRTASRTMFTRSCSLRRSRGTRRRGLLLVVVLVVVTLLALGAATFAQLMLAEYEATELSGRGLQTRALTDSGVETVKQLLAQETQQQRELGGVYDNPQQFQGVLVTDGGVPAERGRFAVLAPQVDEEGYLSGGVRFGLEDESARLNLNALLAADEQSEGAGRTLLLALPGMNEELADAVLDWLDEDETPREFGAEVEYYATLTPPYAPKNGPLESVEELLLVRGMTPYLLFGPDANRNGMVDAGELNNDALLAAASPDADNSNGELNRGLSAYLTLHSQETNLTPEGEPKIDLNNDDLEALYDELNDALGSEWATFIIAYRQNGRYTGTEASGSASGTLDFDRPGSNKLTTVLDLIGPRTQVQFKSAEEPVVLETPFPDKPFSMGAFLPKLWDYTAVNTQETIPGRININQAPRAVLLGIPGMEPEMVDRIIAERDPTTVDERPERLQETWLLTEGIVTLEEMKTLVGFVTGAGSVYRAQVVGYFEEGGPASRIEVVIDSGGPLPRLLFWRDISHLGRGYPLEMLGIEAAPAQPPTTPVGL